MRGHTFAAGALSAALLIGLATVGTPVVADEKEGASRTQEITVLAPRITRERASGSVIDERIVRKPALVKLADLDLSQDRDMLEMERRIRTAATELCEELAREHPHGQPAKPVCIRRAVDGAMEQVRAVFPELAGL